VNKEIAKYVDVMIGNNTRVGALRFSERIFCMERTRAEAVLVDNV